MRRFFAIFAVFAACGLAETFNGTVVDVMCKGKDVASHTKECALGCAKSGYGLVTSDGTFYKFDEAGNAKALQAIKGTSKDKDLRATVSGSMDGNVIKVESITISE